MPVQYRVVVTWDTTYDMGAGKWAVGLPTGRQAEAPQWHVMQYLTKRSDDQRRLEATGLAKSLAPPFIVLSYLVILVVFQTPNLPDM